MYWILAGKKRKRERGSRKSSRKRSETEKRDCARVKFRCSPGSGISGEFSILIERVYCTRDRYSRYSGYSGVFLCLVRIQWARFIECIIIQRNSLDRGANANAKAKGKSVKYLSGVASATSDLASLGLGSGRACFLDFALVGQWEDGAMGFWVVLCSLGSYWSTSDSIPRQWCHTRVTSPGWQSEKRKKVS